jgi:hypothetical protein
MPMLGSASSITFSALPCTKRRSATIVSHSEMSADFCFAHTANCNQRTVDRVTALRQTDEFDEDLQRFEEDGQHMSDGLFEFRMLRVHGHQTAHYIGHAVQKLAHCRGFLIG